jgi:1,4-alpha-glucan branching enzyme
MAKDMQTRINATKKKQMFSYHAPTAMTVQLVGDFTHWQERPISLRKESDGIWRAALDLEPGSHTYWFIVDGQWRDDPDCQMHVPNPYGGQDMVRRVA